MGYFPPSYTDSTRHFTSSVLFWQYIFLSRLIDNLIDTWTSNNTSWWYYADFVSLREHFCKHFVIFYAALCFSVFFYNFFLSLRNGIKWITFLRLYFQIQKLFINFFSWSILTRASSRQGKGMKRHEWERMRRVL